MRMKWLSIAIASFFWLIPLRAAGQRPPQISNPPPLGWPGLPPQAAGGSGANVPPLLSPSQMLGPQSGTNISEADARRVRAAAGISDGDASKHIVLIDGKTLHDHHILLVVSSPEAPCLMAEVFAHHGEDIHRVWSVSATPEGGTFCQVLGCPVPEIAATKAGEVRISVPVRRDGARFDVCDDNILLTYRRAGTSFELEKEEKFPALEPCDLNSEVSATAIHETKQSDLLALIYVLRLPGGATSAIVFAKTPDGPAVTAYDAPLQAWVQNRHGGVFVTSSECIDAAKSAPIEKRRLQLTGDEAQAILDKLAKLRQRTESNNCQPSAQLRCSYTFDGTMFLVIFADGSNTIVRNPPMVAGVRGPGGSASDWAEELHVLVGDQAPH